MASSSCAARPRVGGHEVVIGHRGPQRSAVPDVDLRIFGNEPERRSRSIRCSEESSGEFIGSRAVAIEAEGSTAGALHHGWMTLKDALTKSDPSGVLGAAEQGEDHAVNEYQTALKADISPELGAVVERQFGEVRAAHDQVRALRNAQH